MSKKNPGSKGPLGVLIVCYCDKTALARAALMDECGRAGRACSPSLATADISVPVSHCVCVCHGRPACLLVWAVRARFGWSGLDGNSRRRR